MRFNCKFEIASQCHTQNNCVFSNNVTKNYLTSVIVGHT